jgi:hypothetical protein
MHGEQVGELFLAEIGPAAVAPKQATEVFGKRRGVHLGLHPPMADLDLEEPRRRKNRAARTAAGVNPPGHSSQEVAGLRFDPSRKLDDRVQSRHPKPSLQQADLGSVQTRLFGSYGLGTAGSMPQRNRVFREAFADASGFSADGVRF